MGKLNPDNPFSESCCDGGSTSNDNSAQPCGCDPGARWVCMVHQADPAEDWATLEIARLNKIIARLEADLKELLDGN